MAPELVTLTLTLLCFVCCEVDSPLLAACQSLNKTSGEEKAKAAAVIQTKVSQAIRLKKAYEDTGEEEDETEGLIKHLDLKLAPNHSPNWRFDQHLERNARDGRAGV